MQDIYVGIDISKDTFDVAISNKELKEIKHSIFENNKSGFKELLKYLIKNHKSSKFYAALESTGVYSIPLAEFLTKKRVTTFVINPTKIKYFAKGALYNAKTDKIDAVIILKFLLYNQSNLHEYKLPTKAEKELKELIIERTEIKRLITAQKNRLRALISRSELVLATYESIMQVYTKNLKVLEERIKNLVKENPEIKEKSDELKTIVGVGDLTANTVISMVPEIGKVHQKQLVALVGLAPYSNESGKSKKSGFTRKGRHRVKIILHMAALSAIKYNTILKDVYDRLISKGKKFNVALTAIMRKLLVAMNAIMKSYYLKLEQEKSIC